MNRKLEVIPRLVAEKLEAHAQVIHTLIAAQRHGAAEQFGYAFLAGRALLQAKNIVPNGNAKVPNAGFRRWVEANFPEITLRTAENWMFFAEAIMARAHVDAATSPLLLGSTELTGQSHDSILQLVPEVMDGKGMMHFMRDCRLLRLPTRQRPTKSVSACDQKKKGAAQAQRVWDTIVAKLEAGEEILLRVENAEDLKRYLKALLQAGDKIRSLLKQPKREDAPAPSITDGTSQRQPPRQNHQHTKDNSGK